MKKIPTLYLRDSHNPNVLTREPNPLCEWVFKGAGAPTKKWDGTCMMLDQEGQWWSRRTVKPGKKEPANFVLAEHDENTGKSFGWEPVDQSGFYQFWVDAPKFSGSPPGTYELVGPKIQGGVEDGYVMDKERHRLIKHGEHVIQPGVKWGPVATDFDWLAEWLAYCNEGSKYFEGVVWHHPDGRMAKIKYCDFKLTEDHVQ